MSTMTDPNNRSLLAIARWTAISPDPNSSAAHAYRAEVVKAAARPPVPDRVQFLAEQARGKRVLDLGVVNHTTESAVSANWLHDHIRAVAAYCLGLDILASAVKELRDRGYNVEVFDITSDSHLGESFDLIVAGEIIEHLGAPQALFEFARTHLAPGGQLMISTPHPYFFPRAMMFFRGRDNESVDHIGMFFPSAVAELAERSGLRLAEYRGIQVPLRTWKGRLFRAACMWIRLSPEILCDTLLFTCTRSGDCV